jgi:hypothetical protein
MLLQEFRRADDLDRKWKVADLLDALLLMTTTRTALRWWFEGNRIEETSLREFMELVISEKTHAKPGYLIAPLLDMRCVGVKGFWSAVRRLLESDIGERCNQEWRKRIARLSEASRRVGVRRLAWSKPCEPPDWLSRVAAGKAGAGPTVSLLNGVRNRAMLERIIKIMVSGQWNSCPGFLIGAGFLKCREARRHSNFGRRRQRAGATNRKRNR